MKAYRLEKFAPLQFDLQEKTMAKMKSAFEFKGACVCIRPYPLPVL